MKRFFAQAEAGSPQAGRHARVVSQQPSRPGTHAGGRSAADLGAAWFWPDERRVAELAAELGVAAFPQHVDGDALVDAGPGVAPPRNAGNWAEQAGDCFRLEGGAQARLRSALIPYALRPMRCGAAHRLHQRAIA